MSQWCETRHKISSSEPSFRKARQKQPRSLFSNHGICCPNNPQRKFVRSDSLLCARRMHPRSISGAGGGLAPSLASSLCSFQCRSNCATPRLQPFRLRLQGFRSVGLPSAPPTLRAGPDHTPPQIISNQTIPDPPRLSRRGTRFRWPPDHPHLVQPLEGSLFVELRIIPRTRRYACRCLQCQSIYLHSPFF